MDTTVISKLISQLESNSSISDEMKTKLVSSIIDSSTPLETDKWLYRFVVGFLGIAVVFTIAGGIYLTKIGGTSPNFQLPQGIVAIGSAAIGALAGLLAPSPNNKR